MVLLKIDHELDINPYPKKSQRKSCATASLLHATTSNTVISTTTQFHYNSITIPLQTQFQATTLDPTQPPVS